MMQKLAIVPGTLQIPPNSIIHESYRSLEKLTDPTTQPHEIEMLAQFFKLGIDARCLPLAVPLPSGEAHLHHLEFITYWALLLFTHYITLTKQGECKEEDIELWLNKWEKLQRHIENLPREFITEHLIYYKISLFLSAMKAHVEIVGRKKISAVLLSVYHFACTLQEYQNYVTSLRKIKGFTETAFTREAASLFYNDQSGPALNSWCKVVTQIINRAIGHITVHSGYPEHEVAFLKYAVGCLCENKPLNSFFPDHILHFNFPEFQKTVLTETITQLLSTDKKVSDILQQQSVIFAHIKFLQTQFLHPETLDFIGFRTAAGSLLRNALPYLFIYLYFFPSFNLNFLGTEPAGYTDVTDEGRTKQFLQRVDAATEQLHFEKLIELANAFNNNALRHLFLYLLMDRVNASALFRQAVKKIKISKFGEPLLKHAIETLDGIFSLSSQSLKVQTIKNYLIMAEKNLNDWKSLSFCLGLLLICKKGLELKDNHLTARIHEVLEKFYTVISGKPFPKKEEPKKKKKNNKKKKTKNQAPPTPADKAPASTQTTVLTSAFAEFSEERTTTYHAFAETTEISVAVEIPPQAEPQPPSPKTPSPPDSEPEENTVFTTTKIIAALSTPKPTVSLGSYLKRNKHLKKYISCEKLSEQDENAKIKTRSHFNPLHTFMTLFNGHATEENQFKFALFLFGSVQHRQRYFTYPVFANDIDFRTNCTFEELDAFLSAHATDFKFTLHPVYGKHPIIKIKFTEDPSVVIDIVPMRNEENRELALHTLIKQLQSVTDFPENSVFSTICDDEEIFIDTQGGLSCLSAKNRELRLTTHDLSGDAVPFTLLRTIRFLAKYPDYKFHATLLTWIHHNKLTLSTLKDNPFAITVSHAFVKMLYSGRAARCLALLNDLHLLKLLSPELETTLSGEKKAEFIARVEQFDVEQSQTFQQRPFEDYSIICREILSIYEIKLNALEGFLNNSLWKSSSTIYTSLNTQPGEQNGIGKEDRRSDFSPNDTK